MRIYTSPIVALKYAKKTGKRVVRDRIIDSDRKGRLYYRTVYKVI